MPSVKIRTARKPRTCTYYPCTREIAAGDVYVRHVAFPGDEGHEHGTRPWVISECRPCADRPGQWLRERYGVPARVGMRVEVDGASGRIYGFGSGLMVAFDDGGVAPVHPTWRVVYHTSGGPKAYGMPVPGEPTDTYPAGGSGGVVETVAPRGGVL